MNAVPPRPFHPCLRRAALPALLLNAAVAAAQAQAPAPAPAAAASAPRAGETQLPLLRATAAATADGRSEGSGSYTPGATRSATGLELGLRDTPQSITVITRERIEQQAMPAVADVLVSTPGVSLKAVDRGRNTLSVRGFDVTNFLFDGVPATTGNIGIEEQSSVIYDRVEVVRGSTGLLSGAGDPAAAINLVRKHADSKTLAGWASLELGSWNRRAATVDLSTPLTADGRWRAGIVAQGYRQDAFIDLERTRGSVVYAVLDADLTPDTRLSLGASDQRDRRSGVLWLPLPLWYSDGTRIDWQRSATSATRWNQWDTTEQTAFATLQHRLANRWNLRADLSWHRQEEDSKLLWLWGTPERGTGLGMQAYPYHYHADPQDTQLTFSASGPFELLGRRHEATFGLLRSRQSGGWTNRDAVGAVAEVGDFRAWDGSYPEPALTEAYVGSRGSTTESAAYAAARLQLTPALKLIGGLRWSQWKREEQAGAWTPAAYTMAHRDILTPYAGLVFDLGEQVSAYASYTDIFKPQTSRDRNGNYLDPLQGRSLEAGLKGEFLGGRLNASAAVFRIEQDNFAVPDVGFFVPGTSDPAMRAARGTVSRGYELEVVGEPLPGWNLSAGWTHFRARDASGVDVASHHPRQQLKFSSSVALARLAGGGALAGLAGLTLGTDVRWENRPPKYQVSPTGAEVATGQPAHTIVDLMARYDLSRQWQLQLNLDNAFDKQTYSGSAWWDGALQGEPRSWKLSARYSF